MSRSIKDLILLCNVDGSMAVGFYDSGLCGDHINRATCKEMLQGSDFLHCSIHGSYLSICGICSNRGLYICGPRNNDTIECTCIELHGLSI